jgi:hypothetical protein
MRLITSAIGILSRPSPAGPTIAIWEDDQDEGDSSSHESRPGYIGKKAFKKAVRN